MHSQCFLPQSQVWGLEVTQADIDEHFPREQFMAKWGPMKIAAGDYLCLNYPNADEVYRIDGNVFLLTYTQST